MDRNDAPESELPADNATPAAPAPEATPAPAARATSIFDDADDDDDTPAPAADKEPAPAAEKALAEGEKPAAETKEKAAEWRADWREAIANGDEKRLNELKRYASMNDWVKAQQDLRKKLSSGEYIRKPAANATEEEKAKWREEMGIPKAPTEYELPKDVPLTDADKPMLDSFLQALHAADAPQPIAQAAIGWYGKFVEQQREHTHNLDKAGREELSDALHEEWGQEFKANRNLVDRLLKEAPEGVFDAFANARGPDGKLIRHSPATSIWLASLAAEKYGAGGMLYGDAKVKTTSRLEEIEKIMNTDYDRYMRENLGDEAIELRRKLEAGKR